MELGTIIGFASGIVFIILSILLGAEFNVSQAIGFADGASVMITVGGTIAAVFVSYPLSKIIVALKASGLILKPSVVNPSEVIQKINQLANLARREGLLALEDATRNIDDNFLQKGIMLIVDGTDPELVRSILETEIAYIEGRHSEVRGVWEAIGSLAPAWGMIGTLIGLILMLQNMNDPTTIGPKMSIALVTTFYGSLMANFIANPIASKMKSYSGDEMLVKEVLIEGILSIQAGENPRIIEEKLKAFLSPTLRSNPNEASAGAGE